MRKFLLGLWLVRHPFIIAVDYAWVILFLLLFPGDALDCLLGFFGTPLPALS